MGVVVGGWCVCVREMNLVVHVLKGHTEYRVGTDDRVILCKSLLGTTGTPENNFSQTNRSLKGLISRILGLPTGDKEL